MTPESQYPVPPTPSVPRPAILVIYHARCADGFTAAWVAWRVFGEAAEYLPADHAAPPVADVAGRHVFVLDFSFPRETLIEMKQAAASLQLLDHHLSAAQDLAGLPFAYFDLEKSGAMLAWEYFFPEASPPRLVDHINDRDLGAWRLPHSAAFLSWLEEIPRTFHNWERIVAMNVEEVALAIESGRRLHENAGRQAQQIARRANPIRLFDIEGLVVECPLLHSGDVGLLLAQRSGTFGLCWMSLEDGRVAVSVRSVLPTDAGKLAQRFGGGGHRQRAGFRMDRVVFDRLLGARGPTDTLAERSAQRWIVQIARALGRICVDGTRLIHANGRMRRPARHLG